MVRFRLAAALLVLLAALVPALVSTPAQAAPPPPRISVAGGDTLLSASGARCQLGFNITGRGILTSARCGPTGTRWYAGSVSVGVTALVFAGKDAAVISIDNPAVRQIAGRRVAGGAIAPVTTAGRAYVGQTVTYFSSTLGTQVGTVTGINQTINYGGGALTGMDRTTLCASARDGGAPIVAGSVGLSMLTGGSTACAGGPVFAQPIVPLLIALGHTLY
jgi:hypothetical protein